jgi:hypothetical protein
LYAEKISEALQELDQLNIQLDNNAYISEMTEALIVKIKDTTNFHLLQLLRPTYIEGNGGSALSQDKFYIIRSNDFIKGREDVDYAEIAAWIDKEPVRNTYKAPMGAFTDAF